MNEAGKTLVLNAVKEWTKFVNEREKMRTIATELAAVTQKVVFDAVSFLKSQNVDAQADSIEAMKVMGHPVVVEPVIDAIFPSVKAKVNMTCSGATRSIVINPNGSISAGGNPFMFEQLKKAIPDSFTTNAAEFVSDAFLFIARNQTPEAAAQSAPPPQESAPAPQPLPVQPAPPAKVPPRPVPPAAPPSAVPPRPSGVPGQAPPRPMTPLPGGPNPPQPPRKP